MIVSLPLASCADRRQPSGMPAASGRAVYSPPARLSKKTGAILVLPDPKRRDGPKTSLYRPDHRQQSPTSAWLAGSWLQNATVDDLSPAACNTGAAYSYLSDGTTLFWEGEGRWQLRGDSLIETLTSVNESTGDPEMLSDIGRPSAKRIRRVGPNEGAIWEDGRWRPMVRCTGYNTVGG